MIDFYYWPTPNGWKVSIMLEETGLAYQLCPVNIGAGDQFKPEFLAISPNARMPAIVDHDAADGPLPVFESGAILIHLAEKAGRFMPSSARGRKECLEWLFWQIGNLGPMAGQLSHFVNYAKGVEDAYSYRIGAMPGNTTGAWACWSSAWTGGRIYWRTLDCRHDLLALGADRQATRPGAGRVPECVPLAGPIKDRPAVQRGVDLGKELRRRAPPKA